MGFHDGLKKCDYPLFIPQPESSLTMYSWSQCGIVLNAEKCGTNSVGMIRWQSHNESTLVGCNLTSLLIFYGTFMVDVPIETGDFPIEFP